MRITPESFSAFLDTFPQCKRLLIAYSGGMDSHVLLHLGARIRPEGSRELRAVHVNHNLQAASRDWVGHCRTICRALDVELEVIEVDASQPGGESPEDRARQLRYGAIEPLLAENEFLLTAHHRDDQLETFFLRLFRGAGILGLASMRAARAFGRGLHGRPLLHHSRAELRAYAERHHLDWIEDPSNADRRPDRNFLRHEVLPVIKSRWPGVALPVTRTIEISSDTQSLLDEMAREDLALCATEKPAVLLLGPLGRLPLARQKNVLRHWCRVLNLPTPGSRHLARIISDIIRAGRDSGGRVRWKGAELRRYGDYLCLAAPPEKFDGSVAHPWDFSRPCRLQYGELTAVAGRGDGLKQVLCANAGVEVRYRAGGEEIRLPGRAGRHKIKKLFQEAGVPPWLRGRIPFIYIDNQLAMVAGLWTDAGFLAEQEDASWIVTWSRSADLLFLKPMPSRSRATCLKF